MTSERPPRRRVLDTVRERLEEASGDVQSVAVELASLNASDRIALSEEVRGLGKRLQDLTAKDLVRLDETLRLTGRPTGPRFDLKATGLELSQLGTSLAQVGLSLDRASMKIGGKPGAGRHEDPRSFWLFTQGVAVSDQGYTVSHLARRLLFLGEEQLRFLRILLDKGVRTRPPPKTRRQRRKKEEGSKDNVWGGLESEDLVRKDPRKRGRQRARGGSPKRILNFNEEPEAGLGRSG